MAKIGKTLQEMFAPSKEHWVIKSEKKRAIWQKPYLSYQQAKDEFDLQYSKLSVDDKVKSDWRVEHKHSLFNDEPKYLPEPQKLLIDPLPNF